MPGVVGLPRDEAVAVLEDAGLRPNVRTVVTVADPAQDGIVIAQAPEQGSTAVAGDRVRINVGRFFGNTDDHADRNRPGHDVSGASASPSSGRPLLGARDLAGLGARP